MIVSPCEEKAACDGRGERGRRDRETERQRQTGAVSFQMWGLEAANESERGAKVNQCVATG